MAGLLLAYISSVGTASHLVSAEFYAPSKAIHCLFSVESYLSFRESICPRSETVISSSG